MNTHNNTYVIYGRKAEYTGLQSVQGQDLTLIIMG